MSEAEIILPETGRDEDAVRMIIVELYEALESLDAPEELLAILCSWRDTMDDVTTLQYLRAFNRDGTIIEEVTSQFG